MSVLASPAPAAGLRPAPPAQGRSIQACATSPPQRRKGRRWDSAFARRLTRPFVAVKHLIRWYFGAPAHSFRVPCRSDTACADYIIAVLRFLSVRHLAVIDSLELEFEPGLNVLTGETGAGKSILVGAVGLLVGGRASADLVRTGEETASVEAIFEAPDGRETDRPARDLRPGPQPRLHQRRPGHQRGASGVSGRLVDLHGQHEHQVLLDPSTHLDLLDEFAGARRRARRGRRPHSRTGWRSAPSASALLTGEREKASRAEFLTFQLGEIDRAALKPGEDEELDGDAAGAGATPTGSSGCAPRATTSLYEGDEAVLPALGNGVEAARRSRRARPAVRAVPRRARRRQIAARGSRVLPARLCRRHRRVAGAAAGGRGSAGAPRASEAEARADARRRHRQGANGCGGNSHDLEHGDERRPQNWTRRLRTARESLSRQAAALPHGQAASGGGRRSPRRSRNRSPTWP